MKKLLLIGGIAILLSTFGCATADVRRQPEVVTRHQPNYPLEMREQGITGEALVEFVIDQEGSVRDVSVVHATNEAFGRAAVACVLEWKYKPATVNGVPVATRARQSFSFELGPPEPAAGKPTQ